MYDKLFDRLKYVEPMVESLATAKELYLTTGKLSQEKFDALLAKDPSKNKKYIEWMCRTYLDDPEIGKFDAVADFDKLVNKKLLKGDEADIGRYESIEKLYDKVKQYEDVKTKGEKSREIKMEGAEKVFENDKVAVYHITSQEASCYYGKGTKWCTAATQGSNYFNRYYGRDNVEFYYILSKDLPVDNKFYRMAFLVHADGQFEAYDAPDRGYSAGRGDWESVLKHIEDHGIPMNIFVHKGMSLNRLKHKITRAEKYDPKTQRRITVETKFVKNKDGSYDITGSVDLSGMRLTTLAGMELKFGVVDGDFNCENTQIESLKGAPTKVTGEFNARRCKLKSLEGAPKEVGMDFNIDRNRELTSLKGAPEKVGGSLLANDCAITSLDGIPKSIGKSIYLNNNKIESLKGLPPRIQGHLEVSQNPLTNIDDMPGFVSGSVDVSQSSVSDGKTKVKRPRFLGGKWIMNRYSTYSSGY